MNVSVQDLNCYPIAAFIFYVIAAGMQYLAFIDRFKTDVILVWILTFSAVVLHAFWLHHIIDLPTGQNISFFNMLSFVVWFMSLILLLTGLRKSFQNLSVLIFPLAAISILLTFLFAAHPVVRIMSGHPGQWLHIWLTGLTFSVVCMAVLQAILLYIQDRLLHRSQHLPHLVKKMPALESMERLLFLMIAVGFSLLTIVCISSVYFFSHILQQPLLKKTILVFITWCVLLFLLLGRRFFGWRGVKAIAYTLTGFFLLIIIYFISSLNGA